MMTKKEQQIAVGEWLGWFWHGDPSWSKNPNEHYWGMNVTSEPEDHLRYCTLPNFPEDLNDINEAMKKLPPHKRGFYNAELSKLAVNRNLSSTIKEPEFIFDLLSASAEFRCEALCRILWPALWTTQQAI